MKPTRTAVAFIYKFHEHFTGGIFWINGSNEKFLKASLVSVKEVSLFLRLTMTNIICL